MIPGLLFRALVLMLFGVPSAVRFEANPIITPSSSTALGTNINGPSLIRAPQWVSHPLGRYYLYFAHHEGKFIRLAYANHLQGPWKIYEPGTLKLEQVPNCLGHVASPDVHVDKEARRIRMYFHCPVAGAKDDAKQKTLVAWSHDGLNFTPGSQILGPSYFRVFHWRDEYYAIARGGLLFRSRDGVSTFEPGPALFPQGKDQVLRHAAVWLDGDTLTVFFSRIGDKPERILRSELQLTPDWTKWKPSAPETVLQPELSYEGTDLPLRKSGSGEARARLRQVRDPAIFEDEGHLYLIYSIAGESGLAIAETR